MSLSLGFQKSASGVSADPRSWVLRSGWWCVQSWVGMAGVSVAGRPNYNAGGVQSFSWRMNIMQFRNLSGPTRFVFHNNGGGASFPTIGLACMAPRALKVRFSNTDGSGALDLNFAERSQAGFTNPSFKNFGGGVVAISEPIDVNLVAGTRYRWDVVHQDVPRVVGDDFSPTAFLSSSFSGSFQAVLDAGVITGYINQDIIANGPGATDTVPGNPSWSMAVQYVSGATRSPKVMWVVDSRMALDRSRVLQERLMNAGGSATVDWFGGILGQSGAAMYMAFRDPLVSGLMEYCDVLVNAADINTISSQALISNSYIGSGVTNVDPFVRDLEDYAQKLGRPMIHYLTYPAGIDTTDIQAQTVGPGTFSAVTYARCIDYRTKMLALPPDRIGLVIDAYRWVMRETGNPSMPLVFNDADVGPPGTPIYGTDAAALDPEVFTFTCAEFDASRRFRQAVRPNSPNWTIVGQTGADAYHQRFSDAQLECFGDGRPSVGDAGLESRSGTNAWWGSKLVCIDNGTQGGNCLNDVLTINETYPVWGRTYNFRCAETPVGGRVYTGTVWKMVVPSNADNKGAGSFVNGLHVDNCMGALCDWMNYKTIIKPLLQRMQRQA